MRNSSHQATAILATNPRHQIETLCRNLKDPQPSGRHPFLQSRAQLRLEPCRHEHAAAIIHMQTRSGSPASSQAASAVQKAPPLRRERNFDALCSTSAVLPWRRHPCRRHRPVGKAFGMPMGADRLTRRGLLDVSPPLGRVLRRVPAAACRDTGHILVAQKKLAADRGRFSTCGGTASPS